MTEQTIVLTRWERKERLGHGGVKRIAEIAGVDAAYVSRVVNGKQRSERIEQLVAAAIAKPGEHVFPPREEATAA
jgi:transcriptional regulator with XRE-family HTH domain